MVGKVAGQRCRGRKRSLHADHAVDGAANRAVNTLTVYSVQPPSPPATSDQTVVVVTDVSPQVPASTANSQPQDQSSAQNYMNLQNLPSPFNPREDEGLFDFLNVHDAEFNFMPLPDVDVNADEDNRPLEDDNTVGAGSGTSEPVHQWYTSAHPNAGVDTVHCAKFDGIQPGASVQGWMASPSAAHEPSCSSTVSVSMVLTPSNSLPKPDHAEDASYTSHALSTVDPRDNHGGEVDHTKACGEIIRTLIIKKTAKMGTLDLILSDCKTYSSRLEDIIRSDEFEQSTASRDMVCTTLNLIIDQLERCIVIDTPEQTLDVGAHFLSPASSCSGSNATSESRLVQQTVRFRCPLPSLSFGALQYDGKEQLLFCSSLIHNEATQVLRLVRLLQHRQIVNGKCRASICAARIQDFWCHEFVARLQTLLRSCAAARECKANDLTR